MAADATSRNRSVKGMTMRLRFIAKDPNSPDGDSPTVWVDEDTSDLVIQGWNADAGTVEECLRTGRIPDHEGVVRVPARMVRALREACDVAERGADRRAVEGHGADSSAPGDA
ncbi:hypothetical protein F4556_005018 [Kitasatospora gansuensis]|uniref:Uncharacterized protein n=1 Tax=Kitasatospora gansuensis TaxID=258050 RepID=A0A7W7WJS6_9ACTN|nr:hypothetical protein [Kitasatospora gansuensis]MBB4949483.1 hypothetical protein [Kitasatospora gansuensis]